MILIKSLIILLLILLITHLVKVYKERQATTKEGFEDTSVDQINSYYDSNIANDLELSFSENVPVVQNTVKMPVNVSLGGELAPEIGLSKLAPSQKVQEEAKAQQAAEEDNAIGKHKKASDKALDMNYLKVQMDELVRLGNEAELIKESFKNI